MSRRRRAAPISPPALVAALSCLALSSSCMWDDVPDQSCPQGDGTVCAAPDVCGHQRGYPPGPVPGFGLHPFGVPEAYSCRTLPARCSDEPTCDCVTCEGDFACAPTDDGGTCDDCIRFAAACRDSSRGQAIVTFLEE